jgi:hypothetical protein
MCYFGTSHDQVPFDVLVVVLAAGAGTQQQVMGPL